MWTSLCSGPSGTFLFTYIFQNYTGVVLDHFCAYVTLPKLHFRYRKVKVQSHYESLSHLHPFSKVQYDHRWRKLEIWPSVTKRSKYKDLNGPNLKGLNKNRLSSLNKWFLWKRCSIQIFFQTCHKCQPLTHSKTAIKRWGHGAFFRPVCL